MCHIKSSKHARLWCAFISTCLIILGVLPVSAQEEPPNGMRQADLRLHAITHANVVIKPGYTIENATIILNNGVIEAVGVDIDIPIGAHIWNSAGKTIYAGLIDAAVLVDPGTIERGPGAHWNQHIHPEINVVELDMPGETVAKSLRELGFTTAAVYPDKGIFRGTGTVLSLAGGEYKPAVYKDMAAMAVGLDRGSGYPNSLMGSIAAFRQTLHDAKWYQKSKRVWEGYPQGNEPPARSDALAALENVIDARQTVLFEVTDEHNFLRAAKLINEFDLNGVILGSGREFRRLDDVVATGLPIVTSLNYPDRPDVSTLEAAESVSLDAMLTWEQSPTNARRLVDAGANVAISTHNLKNRKDIYSNFRRAISNGLTEDEVLAALTTIPAKLLGIEHIVGTIEPGKIANLVVVDTSLFDKKMKILDTWIDGRRYEINEVEDDGFKSAGLLSIVLAGNDPIETKIQINTKKKNITIDLPDGESAKAKKVTFDGNRLSFLVDGRLFNTTGYVQFTGTLTDGAFTGSGALPDRSRFTFTITPTDEEVIDDSTEDDADEETEEKIAEENPDDDGISGLWSAMLVSDMIPGGGMPLTLDIKSTEDGVLSGTLNSEFFNTDFSQNDFEFDKSTGNFKLTIDENDSTSTIAGVMANGEMNGTITSAEGMSADFSATRSGDEDDNNNSGKEEDDVAPENLVYPLGAYGLANVPQQQNVLVTNATIWTCGPTGIIENGYLYIVDGKINAVGEGNPTQIPEGTLVIDAKGKHVTPGLLDCHSHTGISGGVNEGSQAVTAEVRIGDVVNPDDINWYRQLAGGLTACNQLHGSANPIGGQNSVVKLKWGGSAEDFKIKSAISGIKFALGENVKRSQSRYPNTRMGVETMIRDAFTRAVDYRKEWQRYNKLPADVQDRTMPPRKDLELDTLVEILEGKRLVHCHSYRQDEILMLIRIADQFGFTIGTFQHILEGYKVAEAIAAHGAGASSFSDWWAYKVEVMDAIPYNGALMNEVGIVVSFNSDSSELARRLNTEAAKAVRYGGVEPQEALKFVTLNPAKQLRVDDRIGSLEKGKDGDFVIWSHDPLSTYARCEQTWIEGARYFSLEEDQIMRKKIAEERQRLIQKILTFAHGEPDSEKKKKDETSTR